MPKQTANRSDGRYEIKRTIPAEYSADGKPYRKSFYSTISKQDCINQYNAYLLDLGRIGAMGGQLPSQSTKFEEWARTWLVTYKKGKVKDSTYAETYERTVNNYLIPHFGECELKDIKPIDVQTFINEKALTLSDSTLNKIRICLNGMFEVAVDNGMIQKNPAKNIKAKSALQTEAKRTYTQEQYDKIIAFARQHPYGHVIRLMLEVGLRCSELCGLQYGDIDYATNTLNMNRTCTTVNYSAFVSEKFKNKSSKRSIPISSDLSKHIKAMSKSHKNTDFIVTGRADTVTPANFSKYRFRTFFKEFQKNYPEIQALTPHELRHTCGTLLYANSKDIYAVSKYLGHSNIDITVKIYVHDNSDMLRNHLHIV